jgi:general secretion pathway protein A
MSYYTLLGLHDEPFSASPDPDYFYAMPLHRTILARLMIEVRLRRGLSVVLGDIGLGKTTISRKLMRAMAERRDILPFVILDPTFDSQELFLESLLRTFGIRTSAQRPSLVEVKEAIKHFLYRATVEEGRTVVLIVDEAQKLTAQALEILRILLNYETNDQKMLQLILFGQLELRTLIESMPNLCDRVSCSYALAPLTLEETRCLIEFRLKRSGAPAEGLFFTPQAVACVHRASGGSPRRIGRICHNMLTEMVIEGRLLADEELALRVIGNDMFLTTLVPVTA